MTTGATGAIGAGAAAAALALAIILSSRSIHEDSLDVALLSLHEVSSIAASLLRALALVSTVAVAALVRHGDRV